MQFQRSGGWTGTRTVELVLYENATLIYWSEAHRNYRVVQLSVEEAAALAKRALHFPGLVSTLKPMSLRFPGTYHGYHETLAARPMNAVNCLTWDSWWPSFAPARHLYSVLPRLQRDHLTFFLNFEHERAQEWIPESVVLEFTPVSGKHWQEYPWPADWPKPPQQPCGTEGTCSVRVQREVFLKMRPFLTGKTIAHAARIEDQLWVVGFFFQFPHDTPEWRKSVYEQGLGLPRPTSARRVP